MQLANREFDHLADSVHGSQQSAGADLYEYGRKRSESDQVSGRSWDHRS